MLICLLFRSLIHSRCFVVWMIWKYMVGMHLCSLCFVVGTVVGGSLSTESCETLCMESIFFFLEMTVNGAGTRTVAMHT